MDINLSAKDDEFRDNIRAFFDEKLTENLRDGARKRTSLWQDIDTSMNWQRILNSKGWAAPDWPEKFGCTNWTPLQRYIFAQECTLAEAPALIPMGLKMCGPMLIGHGSNEQKTWYLPRILNGEDIWCQGYSEPGSGSDLAALSTAAIGDGDDYIINGTKIWTSYAQHANMMFALVRTSNKGKRQEGISFLLIDMTSAGISVKPIINLEGVHELNQVFFDDVRVPKKNLVGKENDGWSVAKYLLEFERFSMNSVEIRRVLARIEDLAIQTSSDGARLIDIPSFVQELARLKVDADALEISEQRVLANLTAGMPPGPASSIQMARGSEIQQRADMLGVEAAAYYASPLQPEALELGTNQPAIGPDLAVTLMPAYLSNRMYTIAGGSSEIQRNIIAKSVLRM